MRSMALIVLWFVWLPSAAWLDAQTLTGPSILERCERVLAGVEDYTADLTAKVDMERMRIPAMNATLYFKKPDKIHVKSDGFALLPREGFAAPVADMSKRYQAVLQATDSVEGIALYRLLLTPRGSGQRVQPVTVWVDPVRFTIVQVRSTPYRGREVVLKFTYALQEGRYWLPDRLMASFVTMAPDTSSEEETLFGMKPQLDEMRRRPRNGTFEIVYSNYRVNTGLPDDLFTGEQE